MGIGNANHIILFNYDFSISDCPSSNFAIIIAISRSLSEMYGNCARTAIPLYNYVSMMVQELYFSDIT